MAVKLISLAISSKIPRWGFSVKHFSSVMSQIHSQDCHESYQKSPKSTEIDPRVQYLKNRLCPDELNHVLDGTHDLNSAVKVFKWASLQKQFRHTASTYSKIVLKLGFCGNVDEMEGFCREMANDRCPGVEEALGGIVDVFVENGRLDEAMRVILVMNCTGFKISIGKWNTVVGSLVEKQRKFCDVLLIYKEMVKSGTAPNVDTLNHLIIALFDANMGDKALDQFRRMPKKRCSPNCKTFEIIICGLVGLDRVNESLAVMNEMFENRVDPDSSFYSHVIPLLCKGNGLREAMRLFDMMRVSQFQPDVCIYESLTKCLSVNCHFSEATELFCEMRSRGLFNPSADVLVEIIYAYCKLGDFDKARNLLEDNDVRDPSPYNVLLQCYCDSHNVQAAKELLCKMFLLNFADDLSWNIIIQGLCNLKNLKQAYELLGKMIVSSFAPDGATYSSLVTGKCNLSKYEDAMKLFKQVSKNDGILDPDSYSKLMEGLCNTLKFQEATEVFIYMSERNRTLSTYTPIIRGLFKQKRANHALFFLSQILRRGLVLDYEAYCIFIQCMVATSETKYCLLFLDLMDGEGLLPDAETFSSLLSYFSNRHELRMIWKRVDRICQESEVLDPAIHNMLINVLWKEGYRTEASRLLDSMLEKGRVPDANTHKLLIGSCCKEEAEEHPKLEHENMETQDEVSSILSEGLGET